MKTSRRSITRQLLIMTLAGVALITTGSVAQAKYGRDFDAHYEIQNVTDLGATVRLTLAVRLVNYSGADVTAGTVTVRDPLFMRRILGTLSPSPLSVDKHRSVSLSGEITIPRREYDAWKNGTRPTLVITQKNSEGKDQTSRIEVAQRPLSEVQ